MCIIYFKTRKKMEDIEVYSTSQRRDQGVHGPPSYLEVSSPSQGQLCSRVKHMLGQTCKSWGKPTCRRLWQSRGGGSAFCWQTLRFGLLISMHMTHRATVFFLSLKGQWGWKNQQSSKLARNEEPPPTGPAGLLHGWPTPNVTAKPAVEGLNRIWRVTYFPSRPKPGNLPEGWLERSMTGSSCISQVFPVVSFLHNSTWRGKDVTHWDSY